MKYVFNTNINSDGVIHQELLIDDINPTTNMQQLSEQVSNWVADTQDKALREALITLGWTPPTDKEPNDKSLG